MGMTTKRIITLLSALCISGILIAACSPRVIPQGESQDTPGSDSATGNDCKICHIVEAESLASSTLLASKHASIKCEMCHTDAVIGEIHASVTAAPTDDQQRAIRKKGRTMGTSEFCLACHTSLDALAAKTAEVTLVQDSAGHIVNPHAIPSNEEHASAGVQECFNCHWLHSTSPAANTNCLSCHHSGVYECGTCHTVDK